MIEGPNLAQVIERENARRATEGEAPVRLALDRELVAEARASSRLDGETFTVCEEHELNGLGPL